MGEAISCRRLYDLLKAVPDLVSDEEKLIDFESSVSQEEHMEVTWRRSLGQASSQFGGDRRTKVDIK